MSSTLTKLKNFLLGDFKSFSEMKQVKIPEIAIKWSMAFLLFTIISLGLGITAMLKYDYWFYWDSTMILSFYAGASTLFFSAFLYMRNFPASRFLLILTTALYNYLLTVLFFQTTSFAESLMYYPFFLGLSFLFIFFIVRSKKNSVDLAFYLWNALFPLLAIFPLMLLGIMSLFSFNPESILTGGLFILVGYFIIKAIVLPTRYRVKKIK